MKEMEPNTAVVITIREFPDRGIFQVEVTTEHLATGVQFIFSHPEDFSSYEAAARVCEGIRARVNGMLKDIEGIESEYFTTPTSVERELAKIRFQRSEPSGDLQ